MIPPNVFHTSILQESLNPLTRVFLFISYFATIPLWQGLDRVTDIQTIKKKQKTNHNPSPISITASHTEMSSTDIIHPITIRPKPTLMHLTKQDLGIAPPTIETLTDTLGLITHIDTVSPEIISYINTNDHVIAEQAMFNHSDAIKIAEENTIVVSKGASPCIIICNSFLDEEDYYTLVLHSSDSLVEKKGDDHYNNALLHLKRNGTLENFTLHNASTVEAVQAFDTYINSISNAFKNKLSEFSDDVENQTYSLFGSTTDTRGIAKKLKKTFSISKSNIRYNKQNSTEGLSIAVIGGNSIIVGKDTEFHEKIIID